MNKPILSGRGNLLNSVTGFWSLGAKKWKVAITPQKGIRLIFLSQLWINLWWRARSRVCELLQEQAWRHKPTLELQSSLYEKLSFLSNLSRRTFPDTHSLRVKAWGAGCEEDPESKSLRERVRDKE